MLLTEREAELLREVGLLLHRTVDSDTERVAFQLEPPQRGYIDEPALTSLPDGLLATFTLRRSDKDSRLHALRWTGESGWVQLGVIPGAALHSNLHAASLVSDARGNAYVAFVYDPGFDPDSTSHRPGERPLSLVLMRSRDQGASWQVVARDLSARACPPGMEVGMLMDVRLVMSPEGALTVYWKQDNRDVSLLLMRDVTQKQLMVSRSADGEHWSAPQRLEDADLKTTRPFFEDFPVNNIEEVRQSATHAVFGSSPNGRSQVVFWRDARHGAARLFLRASRDGGRSWTPVTPVEPERSALAWPGAALPTDAGPIHLFWVGDDGTANHTVAQVTP